jgi:hypothetical protein
VLAVPVAPTSTVETLRPEVDDLVCLASPEPFVAVGHHFRDFRQVSDEEVVGLLERAREPATPFTALVSGRARSRPLARRRGRRGACIERDHAPVVRTRQRVDRWCSERSVRRQAGGVINDSACQLLLMSKRKESKAMRAPRDAEGNDDREHAQARERRIMAVGKRVKDHWVIQTMLVRHSASPPVRAAQAA